MSGKTGTDQAAFLIDPNKKHWFYEKNLMKLPLTAFLVCMTLAGCSRNEESTVSASAPEMKSAGNAGRYLAYEHGIELDVEEKRVASVHAAAAKACSEAVAEQCVMLESHLNTGRDVSANLKFRAKPAGIKKIIAVLSTRGEVIRQSVTAEDLAAPIGDSAKRLALLNDYRSKLEALRGNASQNIDALIKVNQELAQVQSNIESLSGERAHLLQRIETEILTVTISTTSGRTFWRPIRNALAAFGGNLAQGISSAIYGAAYIIPWSITLLLLWWGGRKIWSRRKRANAAS